MFSKTFLLLFIHLLSPSICSSYTETPSSSIKYIPNSSNDLVGVKGLKSSPDGLILRRSLDQGGIVYFLADNKYPEWSFSYTITDLNLHFPEEGGVYLWYTQDDQDFGDFRGGHNIFHGMMAGIEFKGLSPELVFAFNSGEDLKDTTSLYRDSFSPDRLKNVKDLTIKVIVTRNNFKIELYNDTKLIYDHMRIVSVQPHKLLGIDKRFSITSYYKYTSSEKAFKLIKAQLYSRQEHDDYDSDKINSESIKIPTPDEILHSDKEMRHFIANFQYFQEYIKSVLGDTDNPSIKYFSNKILEKVEGINKKLSEGISQHISERVNDMDIRLQSIQKNMTDLIHKFEQKEEKTSHVWIYLVLGSILLSILGFREYFKMTHNKSL
ncbi:L-type lectin-like domain-containing protein [Vairimorpha necatrix]|uniref:L-type lectin-like domain-containing protein n=1 Tax=Vairimorpha necatrix TaxID=6039 RepID=A0AAX4JG27_9MICR